MKSNNRSLKLRNTFSAIAVTIIIAILASWFNLSADRAVVDATISEMEQIGVQMEIILENSLKENLDDLVLISEYLIKNDVNEDTILRFFDNQSQINEFNNLYYITQDGQGISADTSDHTLRDFSNDESYLTALEQDYHITEPHLSSDTNDLIFEIFLPVKQANEIKAMLFCEVPLNGFLDNIESITSGYGDVFFVDYELNLIYSTSESHVGALIIPESDISQMGMENIINAQKNLSSEVNGSFYYDYYGIPKIMVYMPINLTEWAFAINIETHALNSNLEAAVNQLSSICIAIYWFLIILICYTSFYHVRSIKLLEKSAYFDVLTDLPNNAKLEKDMKYILEHNTDKPYSILKFDVDNFKLINEIFGFDVGDKVLKVPKYVYEQAKSDTSDIIVSRVGTDEYLTFAPTAFLSNIEEMTLKYEAIYKQLIPELENYNIVFKYGRYNISLGETNITEIINKVTLAHNMSKTMKGLVVYDYDENYKARLVRDAEITRKTPNAMTKKEFKVFLQPKFSVNEEKLIGAEALVRWIEDDGGMIYPGDFIPLFEKNGFIVELDRYVFEHVCIALRRWLDEGATPITISVNFSRLHLQDPMFVDHVLEIADRHNVPHECLEIELTESAAIENEVFFEMMFAELRDLGFKISIDDFGAGYSSLGLLKNMKVDTLKLDRSFFVDVGETVRGDHVVSSIIEMAHGLDMYVVAEGIETAEQIQTLRGMNCDAIQGYYYSMPISLVDFEKKYIDLIK